MRKKEKMRKALREKVREERNRKLKLEMAVMET